MTTLDTIVFAEQNQSLKEEISESFFFDVMSQMDALDPTDDGDELIKMIHSAMTEDTESSSTLLQLFSFLLGTSLEDWLEEFGSE